MARASLRWRGTVVGTLLLANAACIMVGGGERDSSPDGGAESTGPSGRGESTAPSTRDAARDAPHGRAHFRVGHDSGADSSKSGPDPRDSAADAVVGEAGQDARNAPPLVVAMRDSAEAPADLFVIPFDGGPPWPLGQTPSRHEVQPRWSPDRSKIAFLAVPANAPIGARASLFVVDADGTNERELATDVSSAFAHEAGDAFWPPAWSPTGGHIAYVHALDPCPPPPNPNWYQFDPCVSDLRSVRVADGVIEDPNLPSEISKWATEPIWLAAGPLLYVWTCFGEACSDHVPTLVQEHPSRHTIQLLGRQLAFTRDASRFAVKTLVAPNEYAARESPTPIAICDSAAAAASQVSSTSCVGLGGAPTGWSPRWSPREDALVFLDATGVWVQTLGAPSPERRLQTPRPAGVDW